MKAYTKQENLEKALEAANKTYKGNIRFKRFDLHKNHVVFTLTVNSTKDETAGYRRGFSGQRVSAACWHAHRDFMKALFNLDPDCRLTTAQITYQNQFDFEQNFQGTGDANIGSMVNPMSYRFACDCR